MAKTTATLIAAPALHGRFEYNQYVACLTRQLARSRVVNQKASISRTGQSVTRMPNREIDMAKKTIYNQLIYQTPSQAHKPAIPSLFVFTRICSAFALS